MQRSAPSGLSQTVQEIERRNDLLHLLTDDVCALLEDPPDHKNAEWVVAVLDKMLENLQGQVDLERERRYLEQVLEQFPSWHPQVLHLQQEQQLLFRQLREIRDRVSDRLPEGVVNRECRRQLADWVEAYKAHQRRESQLLQDAFTLEVGEGE